MFNNNNSTIIVNKRSDLLFSNSENTNILQVFAILLLFVKNTRKYICTFHAHIYFVYNLFDFFENSQTVWRPNGKHNCHKNKFRWWILFSFSLFCCRINIIPLSAFFVIFHLDFSSKNGTVWYVTLLLDVFKNEFLALCQGICI